MIDTVLFQKSNPVIPFPFNSSRHRDYEINPCYGEFQTLEMLSCVPVWVCHGNHSWDFLPRRASSYVLISWVEMNESFSIVKSLVYAFLVSLDEIKTTCAFARDMDSPSCKSRESLSRGDGSQLALHVKAQSYTEMKRLVASHWKQQQWAGARDHADMTARLSSLDKTSRQRIEPPTPTNTTIKTDTNTGNE